jgi:hypothetical protein
MSARPSFRDEPRGQLGFGQEVPWPLHEFWPAHEAFAPALQPLLPLHSFFPLQQSLAAGASVVDGAAAGGVAPPPQPATTPTSIPETADTARAFPMFILPCLLRNALSVSPPNDSTKGASIGFDAVSAEGLKQLRANPTKVSFGFANFFERSVDAASGRVIWRS